MPTIEISERLLAAIEQHADAEDCGPEALIMRALWALGDQRNTVALAAGLDGLVERLKGAPIGRPPDGLLVENPVTLLHETIEWVHGAITLYRCEHMAMGEMLNRQMLLHPEDFEHSEESEDEDFDEFVHGPSVWKRLRQWEV